MALIRLDKYLSNQAGMSRSEAREALKSLRVTVNGVTEKHYDYKVEPGKDIITVNGNEIAYNEYLYVLLNKPKGVLTATEDKRQKTVLDLLPEDMRRRDMAPVGRLDKDTTGLLLLTDDGVVAHKIISPKSKIEKEYIAVLDGAVTDEHVKAFAEGIKLADGSECMPARLKILGENTASITICEGKYHQIKRMFGTVGLGVNELSRIRIGQLRIPEGLAEGEAVLLSGREELLLKISKRA